MRGEGGEGGFSAHCLAGSDEAKNVSGCFLVVGSLFSVSVLARAL